MFPSRSALSSIEADVTTRHNLKGFGPDTRATTTGVEVSPHGEPLSKVDFETACSGHTESPPMKPNFKSRTTPVVPLEYPPAATFAFSPDVYNECYLLETYPNFRLPQRVDVHSLSSRALSELIERVVVVQGKPLVLQNFQTHPKFDKELFSMDWLRSHFGSATVMVRDLRRKKDIKLPFDEFLSTNQGKAPEDIVYYGKDLACPEAWCAAGKRLIPSCLQPMGINDLNRLLPPQLRAENLMIYVGHQGTHTASHFDLCASLGHNLMVHADEGCSALWMMVPRPHANDARKFWHQHGGGNTSLDQDNCTLPADVMAKAEFPIYAFEQHLGDLVVVPSECAHQVINLGPGTTVKYAWNRNTAHSLDHCIRNILPCNRRILKPEVFRTKAIVAYCVDRMDDCLRKDFRNYDFAVVKPFLDSCRTLLQLYAKMIADDCSPYLTDGQVRPRLADEDQPHQRVCDYCHCDIWNSWFQCTSCDHPHDLCVECYAESRRCSGFRSMTLFSHRLIQDHFQKLLAVTKLFNACSSVILPNSDPVKKYFYIQDLELLHPSTISPMTLALQTNFHYREVRPGEDLPPVPHPRFKYDLVCCTHCKKQSFCHACIANRYGVDPFQVARLKDWACPFCQKTCNCSKCVVKNGGGRPHPTRAYRQTDYHRNYELSFGLSYTTVGRKGVYPNLVDSQTFLDEKMPLSKPPSKLLNDGSDFTAFCGSPASKRSKLTRDQARGSKGAKRKALSMEEPIGESSKHKRNRVSKHGLTSSEPSQTSTPPLDRGKVKGPSRISHLSCATGEVNAAPPGVGGRQSHPGLASTSATKVYAEGKHLLEPSAALVSTALESQIDR
ncbi:hypothetical protein L0F63_002455, partial [Massospora cicadina]